MLVLGIESSCDETGAAVVDDAGHVLSDVVQSQVSLHAPYGGVIPELASRDHLRNVGPVVREALARAGVGWEALEGIAVTNRPGLVGALLVGVQAAKGLAWGRGLPLVGVDHLVGHLLAVFLRRGATGAGGDLASGVIGASAAGAGGAAGASGAAAPGGTEPSPGEEPPAFPFVALLASGGHTAIYRVDGPTASAVRELGATRDDAAGEAFDKVAKVLGLPYPGGPAIDRLARSGDPKAVRLTLPMGHDRSFDLSFSGIKTQVAARVRERGAPATPEELADTCASFQAAVTSVLAKKLVAAAVAEGVRTVVIGGGVAANSELRARVTKLAGEHGLRAVLPELASCTDNAAMIAYAGLVRLRAGERDGWELVATSATSLPRTTRKGRGAR